MDLKPINHSIERKEIFSVYKIKFEVRDRVIKRIGNFGNTVGDNSDYEAEFLFDSEWDGHIKTARFIQSGKYVEQMLENDKCLIPVEVLKHGYLKVGVFTSEMTTTQCDVFIKPSIKQDNGVTAPPTPDVYSQIISMIENMEVSGVTDEQIEKAVTKYLSEHPIETLTESDVQRIVGEYVSAHKEEFKGEKGDKGDTGASGRDGLDGSDGIDGKSAYDIAVDNGFVGTEVEWLASLHGNDGKDGKDGNGVSYRWEFVDGTVYPCKRYNVSTNSLQDGSTSNVCVYYTGLIGISKVKLSAAALGSSGNVAWAFLDENGNVLEYPAWESGKQYKDTVVDVPAGAVAIYVNGNNYTSPHIELAVIDAMADITTLPYLLKDFARKISYREDFAWKPMDKGYIALTFDDSLDDIDDVYNIAHEKGVPVCFGAIPEKLLCPVNDTQTVCDIMRLAVADGGEVLAHGSSATEIVTADNIDDLNFLYTKFVVNKQKFRDFGFDVRGNVRVGGSGNICNDARTDVWQRLIFDYGDAYGIAEPYNHSRGSFSTDKAMFEAIDKAIAEHTFLPLLFHAMPANLGAIIDYIISKGGAIVNYATVYDTFGSTKEVVDIENRLKAVESIQNGNEVAY